MTERPPKFFTRLFKWFCEDDFFEELQGDLEEKFLDNAERLGTRKARNLYRKEVLQMIRPSVLKTPSIILSLIKLSLFQIHLKLAVRNLVRNKTFSFVNILGLAASLCLCLFLVNVLYTGYNFDRQHKELDRLYRVTTQVKGSDGNIHPYATTPSFIKEIFDTEIPQIESTTSLDRIYTARFNKSGTEIYSYGYFIDRNFFKLFNFQIIEGDPFAIFETGTGIAITETLAKKLYGEESALGKKTTTGVPILAVIASAKTKSHLQFEVLSSSSPLIHSRESQKSSELPSNWASYTKAFTYVRLSENTTAKQVNDELARLRQRGVKEGSDRSIQLKLQHINDIMFGAAHTMDQEYVFDRNIALIIIGLMVLVIALASFNYTNLSIARALQRTKEIGIRKITGSSSVQVAGQYMIETIVFSLLALIIALMGYKYFSPVFPVVMEELSGLFNPNIDLEILLVFTCFTLLVGFLAGILPAIHFAKVNPLNAINARVKARSMSLSRLRKILTAVQLTVSMFAVFFISITFDQYRQLLHSDLGFQQESLITFPLKKIDQNRIVSALEEIPEIASYALTSFIPGATGTGLQKAVSDDKKDTILIAHGIAGPNFQEVYKASILKGTSLPKEVVQNGIPAAIVSPKFLQRLRIPLDSAIGKLITRINKRGHVSQFQVVGILNGFVRNAFDTNRIPIVVENRSRVENMTYATIRFTPRNTSSGLDKIQTEWLTMAQKEMFEPKFVSDVIEESYTFFHGVIKSFSFIGLVIVIISILGQLGIALYNAQTRVKEIGIRKVLGARTHTITNSLLRGTVITFVIAISISAPCAYLATQDFFPIEGLTLEVTPFAIIRAITLFILVVYSVIISQTWRIANQNPADSLRNE